MEKINQTGECISSAKKIKKYNYTNLIVDPTSHIIKGEGHSRVYIFGRGGIFRSDDAGKSWKELSKSFGEGQIADMVLVRKGKKSILFTTAIPAEGLAKAGVYRSDDHGETWNACNNGLDTIINRLKSRNKPLAVNPNAYAFTLMIAHSPAKPNRLYVGSWQGGARSDDLGETWKMVLPPESTYLPNPVAGSKNKFIGMLHDTKKYKKSLWGGADSFHRLVAAPSNGDIVAFSDNQGLYCSFDGGATWDDITFDYGEQFAPNVFKKGPENRYTHTTRSRGVQNIVCKDIAVDPFNPKIYYAAYMDLGPEISRDGGEYWERPLNGMYARGHAWAVAVDPERKGRVFVSIGGRKSRVDGLMESNDFGKSWKRVGLYGDSKGATIYDIKIDYSSPANNRTIYLATFSRGVYKSNDDGKTWKNCFDGFSQKKKSVKKLQITPDGKSVYAGTKAGLLVSHDKGETWTLIKQNLFGSIKDFSVSKSDPDYIYVSAEYPGKDYWGGSSFFMTSDAGKTWKNITPDYMKFTGGIMVNPYDPEYVYACIDRGAPEEGLIIRSKNAGKTWEDIGGQTPFTRGVKFCIDSQNAKHLFVLNSFGVIEIYDPQAPNK